MTLSDPVANMLTSIRNANMRGHRTVIFSHSSFKWMICKKLEKNNYLSQCWFDKKNKNIKVEIKYSNQKSCINQLKKISKPSQHVHLKVKELKKYCRSHGVYLITTPDGLLTHREALEKRTSGKVILLIN